MEACKRMTDTANRFLRQLDILPPEKLQFPIVVIGAGAIGSATVVTLAKMGCSSITVWDHDTLEEHNASNQLCRLDAVGKPKVEALAQLTTDLTGVSLKPICAPYRGQRLQGPRSPPRGRLFGLLRGAFFSFF